MADLPHSSVGKETTCNSGDPSSIPGPGRSSGEEIGYPLQYSWVSLVAQLVKNPPATQETWVWSSEEGKGYPLQIFWPGEFPVHGAWRIPSPWGLENSQSMGSQRVGHNWATFTLCCMGASQVTLVVKNLPASAGDIRDAGSIPG